MSCRVYINYIENLEKSKKIIIFYAWDMYI